MIPPSLRDQASVSSPQIPFGQQQPQQQHAPAKSATEQDLFSLMDEPDETPSPVAQPPPTARSISGQPTALSPQATGSSFVAPNRELFPPTAVFNTAVNQPLPPSSAPTPRPASAQQQNSFSANGSDDFFGVDESKSIPDHSIELGQTQNALNASAKGLSTLSNQRAEMEKSQAAVEAELQEMKDKLTASRANYEAEQKVVNELTIRAGEQKKELANVKKEVVTAESDLSALRDEKREWEGVTMRDKEEIRGLKSKLGEVTKEVSALKLELEKLKKEGRQQKGLLAISKKQLSTAEADKENSVQEISDLKREEAQPLHVEPASFASRAVPSPSNSQIISPAASVRSTNPFERFITPQTTGVVAARSASPVAQESSTAPIPAPSEQPSQPAQVLHVEQDPFATSTQNAFPDDGFGSSAPALSKDFDSAFESKAFDNDFDSAFVPTLTDATHQADPSFDSAFDEFDPPPVVAAPVNQTTALATGAHESHVLHVPAASSSESPAIGSSESIPRSDARDQSEVSDEGQAPPIPLPSQFIQAPAVAQHQIEADSSDDDSGPEDLERPRSTTVQTPSEQRSSIPAQTHLARPNNLSTESPFGNHSRKSRSSIGSSVDDFEDAQERTTELGSPTAQAQVAEQKSEPLQAPTPADDFDQFDEDFVNLGSSAPNAKPEGLDAFDDSDFNMDFSNDINKPFEVSPLPHSTSAAAPASTTLHPSSNSFFDDSFGSNFNSTPTTSTAPQPSPAAADDLPAVGRLTAMGFSRSKAIEALEKHNYSVEKAANALVSGQ